MIQTTVLNNGITIVTDTISTVETITLGVWVRVGTRYEDAEVNGVSHFLEHMAFKGTQKRTAVDIAQSIEAVGGYLNAFTSREMTAYQARILANDLPLALDILADILTEPTFAKDEFERERGVIQQEILESLDTPDDYVYDLFQQAAFPNQPLGRPILGTMETVAALSREKVRHYMERHYSPDRMVISLAGKLDHVEAVHSIEKLFGRLSPLPASPPQAATYQGTIASFQKPLEQTQFLLGYKGISQGDPLYYTGAILSTLLGGGMSSRLFQEVREKKGLAYTIYCFQSCYQDTGLFTVYASTTPQQVNELARIILKELQAISENLTAEEIQRAKSQLKAGTLMGLENTSTRCERAAQQMHILGRVLSNQETVELIDHVTADDLRALASQLFSTPPTCVTLGPNTHTEDLQEIVHHRT